ncbi:MAG: glycine cleavage system protein GcvH [Promethearchaeota archaeon]
MEYKFDPTCRYSETHEWARPGNEERLVVVGITDYAQCQLGDVVYVQLPEVGAEFERGDEIGEVESVKAVAPYFAPVSGRVTRVNPRLVAEEWQVVNEDPFGEGWFLVMEPKEPGQLGALLDEASYRELVERESREREG